MGSRFDALRRWAQLIGFDGGIELGDGSSSTSARGCARLRFRNGEIQRSFDGGEWTSLASFELSGEGLSDGFSKPLTDVLHVYVMGDIDVQLPDPQLTLGDDSNDGLSKARPLLTLDGVRKMVGRYGIAGKRIYVHLAGGGWPDVADPWDGQCTGVRYYLARDLLAGGTEAYANSFCVIGPRKMNVVAGTSAAVSNFGGDGLRTQWQTSGLGVSAGALDGIAWLRQMRGGRNVTALTQITGNTTTDFWTDNGPNTPGSVYALTDSYDIVQCAVQVVPTNFYDGDDAAADGLVIRGMGAAEIYGRPGPVEDCLNPRLTFANVAFERANVLGHGLSFNNCFFYNTVIFRSHALTLRNCMANCAGGVDFYGDTRRIANTTENAEYNGHALVVDADNPPPTSLTADPIWPARGGPELYVNGGGLRIFGKYRMVKNLSVGAGGITVQGRGAELQQPVGVNILYSRNSGGVGLTCVRGGQAFIDDTTDGGLAEITGSSATNQLKVGVGAAIARGDGAGAFREVGGWAGNFSRHLEVNGGGKPTGDDSRIAESTTWFT